MFLLQRPTISLHAWPVKSTHNSFVFSDMFTIFATNYIQQINEKITYFQRRNINDDIYGVLAKPQQQ